MNYRLTEWTQYILNTAEKKTEAKVEEKLKQ